jgi:hypothetical protein
MSTGMESYNRESMETVAHVAAKFTDENVLSVTIDALGGASHVAYHGPGGGPDRLESVAPSRQPGILAQALLDDAEGVLAGAGLIATGSSSSSVTVIYDPDATDETTIT